MTVLTVMPMVRRGAENPRDEIFFQLTRPDNQFKAWIAPSFWHLVSPLVAAAEQETWGEAQIVDEEGAWAIIGS